MEVEDRSPALAGGWGSRSGDRRYNQSRRNDITRPLPRARREAWGTTAMLGATLSAKAYLDRVCQDIQKIDTSQVENLSGLIEERYHTGRFVFIIGNGGSGANASHLCEDLAKCTLRDFESQKRLRVLSLTDNTPWVMAVANDINYESIFLEQVKNLASPGDLLIAISGSGNSPNILRAVEWANSHGMTTVGVTGFGGGKLKSLAHHNLHAPVNDMGMAESLHQVVFHWVIDDLYRRFGLVTNGGLAAGAR